MAKKRKSRSPRKSGGANMEALRKAGTAARRAQAMSWLYSEPVRSIKRSEVPVLREVAAHKRRHPTSSPRPVIVPVLASKPKQRPLQFTPPSRKAPLRAVTKAALATTPSKRRELDKRPGLREAICAEYRASVAKRRQSMFASGSAGKARRNTGKRTPDWRARYC